MSTHYLTLFALCVINVFSSSSESKQNPNIIFVLTDDWGINDVGWTQEWDNTDTQTPFLNDLAKTESLILSNYYAERVCTASRAAFLTGRYPSRLGLQAGVFHQNQPFSLTRQVSMLSNEFQHNGYSTHLIGKWHLGYQCYEYTPTYRGFDSFYGFWNGGEEYFTHTSSIHYEGDTTPPIQATDLYIDDQPAMYTGYDGVYGVWWQRDEALKLLEAKANELESGSSIAKPFFFYFALQASHNPRQAPEEYNQLYETAGNYEDNMDRITVKAQATTVDDAMKDIIGYVKESGLWDNTLIVFGSDNGGQKTYGDNAPYRGYKNTSWEGGVKVAAFVTGGALNDDQRGNDLSYPMHMTDWYPTLLSAAGLDVKYERSTRLFSQIEDLRDVKWLNTEELELDGVDMWPYIQGEETDDHFFENEREILLDLNDVWCQHTSCGAIRMGRWKYIRGNNIATLLPDYDGSDWDRQFALDQDAAEAWCQANKKEFARTHGVTFEQEEEDNDGTDDEGAETQETDPEADNKQNVMINSVGCQGTDAGCLFDLSLDACEYYSLTDVYPEMVKKFQAQLDKYQMEAAPALMGENNANELAPKQMINPRQVCENVNFWCPFQVYDTVQWEYSLFANADYDDDDGVDEEDDDGGFLIGDSENGPPSLNVFVYMCLWMAMCVGLFFVCKHERGKKHGYFVNGSAENLQELQPLVVH